MIKLLLVSREKACSRRSQLLKHKLEGKGVLYVVQSSIRRHIKYFINIKITTDRINASTIRNLKKFSTTIDIANNLTGVQI